jgi:hypothetical protein
MIRGVWHHIISANSVKTRPKSRVRVAESMLRWGAGGPGGEREHDAHK